VLSVEGWDLAAYTKNPVMLWAHDSCSPPVGRAVAIGAAAGALRAKAEFTPADLYPFGAMVGRMVREGFLNATSVGFRPLKYGYNAERGDYAMDFEKQELLEFSVVPVPANPEALVSAKAAGIDLAPMIKWAESILDRGLDSGLWFPRKDIECAWIAARGSKSVQVPAAVRTPAKEDDSQSPPALDATRLNAACDRLEKLCVRFEEMAAEEEPEEEPAGEVDPSSPDGAKTVRLQIPVEAIDPAQLAAAVAKTLREQGIEGLLAP
jgi:HK97 family phage prohead protease